MARSRVTAPRLWNQLQEATKYASSLSVLRLKSKTLCLMNDLNFYHGF